MTDLSAPDSDTDRGALDRFLASVERRALRMAELATGERDEALDLVQEAMLRFVRSYARRDAAQWPPLFHRVLDNAIRDWGRRRRVRGRWLVRLFGSGEGEAGEPEDPLARIADPRAPEPGRQLDGERSLAHLDAGLRALPQRQRQVFLLRVWEELSVDDTARALGISSGSVKTHLFRALASLRTHLGADHAP